MPTVYHVKKCRKDQGPCTKCGEEIKKGSPYLYWAFMIGGRGGPPIKRCTKPECAPKPSDLTQSEYLSMVYSIHEETTFEAETIEDLTSSKDDVVGELEELRDGQQEKLDNMPDGLREGDTGQLLQERHDTVDGVISELEGIDLSFDEPDRNEGEDDATYEARKAEALKGRIEELREELQSALGNLL